MRPATSPIRLLALASALVLASSCADKLSSTTSLSPPADLLAHADEPEMTADSLTSEEAYERQRDAKIEWGRGNASALDRACWWFQDAGVKSLTCPARPK